MAFRMKLANNQLGLTEIMNVSQKVGTEPDCINRPNDVEVVQRLLNFILPTTPVFKLGFGLITVSGKFDALTGFYLFRFQRGTLLAGHTNDVIDGCVSVAKNAGYGGGTIFTIVALNGNANRLDPVGYQKFMKTFEAKA